MFATILTLVVLFSPGYSAATLLQLTQEYNTNVTCERALAKHLEAIKVYKYSAQVMVASCEKK